MYLYRRHFACSGSHGIVPHLMAELTDLVSELAGFDIELWRGVAGVNGMDFAWTVWSNDLDATRSGLDALRGNRAGMTLLNELLTTGWNGRAADEVSAVLARSDEPPMRPEPLIEELQFVAVGDPQVIERRIDRLASAGSLATDRTEIVLRDIWATTPSVRILRSAADATTLIALDERREHDPAWREARRRAASHLDVRAASRVLWRLRR